MYMGQQNPTLTVQKQNTYMAVLYENLLSPHFPLLRRLLLISLASLNYSFQTSRVSHLTHYYLIDHPDLPAILPDLDAPIPHPRGGHVRDPCSEDTSHHSSYFVQEVVGHTRSSVDRDNVEEVARNQVVAAGSMEDQQVDRH